MAVRVVTDVAPMEPPRASSHTGVLGAVGLALLRNRKALRPV